MSMPSVNYQIHEIGPDGRENSEPVETYYNEGALLEAAAQLGGSGKMYRAYVVSISAKGRVVSREPYRIPLQRSALGFLFGGLSRKSRKKA